MTTPLTNESMHRLADIIADHGDTPLSRAVKAAFPLPSPQSELERWGVRLWTAPDGKSWEYRHGDTHYWNIGWEQWLELTNDNRHYGCGDHAAVLANPPTLPPPNFKENACQTPQASSLPSSSASQSSSGSSSSAAPDASPADAEPVKEPTNPYSFALPNLQQGWNEAATAWRQHTTSLREELERVKGERDAARKVGRTLFQIAQQLAPKEDGENPEVTRAQ